MYLRNHLSHLYFPAGTGNAVPSTGAASVSSALNTGSLSGSTAMRWTEDKKGFEMSSKLAGNRHTV